MRDMRQPGGQVALGRRLGWWSRRGGTKPNVGVGRSSALTPAGDPGVGAGDLPGAITGTPTIPHCHHVGDGVGVGASRSSHRAFD